MNLLHTRYSRIRANQDPYMLLSNSSILRGMNSPQEVLSQISAIREERNLEKRLGMLLDLNGSLPKGIRLDIPSLITNAYVRRALDIIEDRVNLLDSRFMPQTPKAEQI